MGVEGHLLDVLDALEVGDDSGDPSCDFVWVDVVALMGWMVPDLVFLVTTA